MNFVFVLFAIALVSGAQSASISSEIEKVHASISQSIDQAIAEFKKVVDQAKEKANELRKKVTDKAKQVYDDASKLVNKMISDVDSQLRDLLKKAGKIDITECKKIKNTMADYGSQAAGNLKQCFEKFIQVGGDNVNTIIEVSKNTTASASQFSVEARKCFQKNDEGAPAETVIECLKKIASKIKETASTSVDIVSDSVSKMSTLVSDGFSDSPNSITKCVAEESMKIMLEGSSMVMDKTKDCLKDTMNQMSSSQQQW